MSKFSLKEWLARRRHRSKGTVKGLFGDVGQFFGLLTQPISGLKQFGRGFAKMRIGKLCFKTLMALGFIDPKRGKFRTGRAFIAFLVFLLIVGGAGAFGYVSFGKDWMSDRYRTQANNAFVDEEFESAIELYNKASSWGKLSQEDQFQLGKALASTGKRDEATKVIDKLAPDSGIGFGPAHGLKAVVIASTIENARFVQGVRLAPDALEKLEWHLNHGGDSTPGINRAWAVYYVCMEEFEKAIQKLQESNNNDPALYEAISQLQDTVGNEIGSQSALASAQSVHREGLKADPKNVKLRVDLARTLFKAKKWDEAQAVMAEGIDLMKADGNDVETVRFLLLNEQLFSDMGKPFGERYEFLKEAMEIQPDNEIIYHRLVLEHAKPKGTSEEKALIEQLIEDGAERSPTALAHFAISNFWLAKGNMEKGLFHIEEAIKLDSSRPEYLNNCAWMIAHSPKPDLNRASELSMKAVELEPQNFEYRDTFGTILMKLGEYKKASVELELALGGITDKKGVHAKLATVYDELGMEDLAQSHRKRGQVSNVD